MKLVLLSPFEEIASELKKPQLNESGLLPVVEMSREINFDSNFTVLTSGNHLKSKETIKKFSEKFENPGIIIFDAHVDCLNEDDLVPFLADTIGKNNLVIVGCREWSKEEYYFIQNNNIKTYSMKEICFEGKEAVCDAVMAVAKDFGSLFVSIDADVLEPETGGLSVRELLYFLQRLKKLKNFRTADLAEFKDAKLAAKIIRELA